MKTFTRAFMKAARGERPGVFQALVTAGGVGAAVSAVVYRLLRR